MPRGKTKSTSVRPDEEKAQICVRMEQELYDLIERDAKNALRKNPAQIRLILLQHYGPELEKMRRKPG